MKRILLILLSLLLVLSVLVGCDTIDDTEATEAGTESTTAPPQVTVSPLPTESEAETPTEAPSEETDAEMPTETSTEKPNAEPSETESEEETAKEDPTQYPARGRLYDVSTFEHKSILYGSRMWNTILNAPTVSIDTLSPVDGLTLASYGSLLSHETNNFTYSDLYLDPSNERLKAVCKLDDTHLCAIEKVQRQQDGKITYVYGIYEWATPTESYNEEGKAWIYTFEYYVAANAISLRELSDIEIGDSADRLYEIAPCILDLATQRHLNYYSPFVALLLKDGVAFFEIENVSNNSPDIDSLEFISSRILSKRFIPYGESAEINGYSLVMPTAENLPPLPEG